MSAFLCGTTHIATCAAIIADAAPGAGNRTMAEIAQALAEENLRSIAALYDEEAAEMLPGNADGDAGKYVELCKAARPLSPSAAEAYNYLGCLQYQSCAHAEWADSEACAWIEAAVGTLTARMCEDLLDGREVREIGGEALDSAEPRLCPPVHIATGAFVLRCCDLFYLTNVSARETSDAPAAAGFETFRKEGGLEGLNAAQRRKLLAAYKRACDAAPPVGVRTAEAHVLLSRLRDICADAPSPDAPVGMWIEGGLWSNADAMSRTLLRGRHVWEAGRVDNSGPGNALPTP